jgi:hypothetical protein
VATQKASNGSMQGVQIVQLYINVAEDILFDK